MIHNGIEYADMQLIAEIYSVLKLTAGLSNEDLSQVTIYINIYIYTSESLCREEFQKPADRPSSFLSS